MLVVCLSSYFVAWSRLAQSRLLIKSHGDSVWEAYMVRLIERFQVVWKGMSHHRRLAFSHQKRPCRAASKIDLDEHEASSPAFASVGKEGSKGIGSKAPELEAQVAQKEMCL